MKVSFVTQGLLYNNKYMYAIKSFNIQEEDIDKLTVPDLPLEETQQT